jgi:NhaP-type Na+/H+ and K+/H+ antiporter
MAKQAILLTTALFLLAGVGRADWQQVEAMQAGAPIMVNSGFVTNAGKFVHASADAVTVQTQTVEVTVQKADVDAVYAMRSKAERVHRGLLFGGVAASAAAATFFPLTSILVHPNYVVPSVVTASNGVSFGLMGSLNRIKRIYRRD